MSTISTAPSAGLSIESLILTITQEIQVRATLEQTFAALLEQIGPENDTPEGKPMPMKIEPWPGGRWFRDLGEGNGHFWGQVQAIPQVRTLTEGPSHADTSPVECPNAGVNAHTNSTLDLYTVPARADRRSPTIPSLRRSDGRTPGTSKPSAGAPGAQIERMP